MRIELLRLKCLVDMLIVRGVVAIVMTWSFWEIDVWCSVCLPSVALCQWRAALAIGCLVVRIRVSAQVAKEDLGTPKNVVVAVVEGSNDDPGPERRILGCCEMLRNNEFGRGCRKVDVLDCPTSNRPVVRHGGLICSNDPDDELRNLVNGWLERRIPKHGEVL
jgi:hypothetical protein